MRIPAALAAPSPVQARCAQLVAVSRTGRRWQLIDQVPVRTGLASRDKEQTSQQQTAGRGCHAYQQGALTKQRVCNIDQAGRKARPGNVAHNKGQHRRQSGIVAACEGSGQAIAPHQLLKHAYNHDGVTSLDPTQCSRQPRREQQHNRQAADANAAYQDTRTHTHTHTHTCNAASRALRC